jgi:hypothetical protein
MAEKPVVSTQADTERARAVGALLTAARRLIEVGDLRWEEVQEDYRLLVVNYVIRRQPESLEAALKLASENLAHLSVAFVRTALEEMLWVRFLASLEVETSQRLLLAMANYDGLRSLLAQRGFVGDDVMASLWYPVEFLDAAERKLVSVKEDLKQLRAELGWRGTLPSGDWVAESVMRLLCMSTSILRPADCTLFCWRSLPPRVGESERNLGHRQIRVPRAPQRVCFGQALAPAVRDNRCCSSSARGLWDYVE